MPLVRASNGGTPENVTVIASGNALQIPQNTITIPSDFPILIISWGGYAPTDPTYNGAGTILSTTQGSGSPAGSGYTHYWTKVQIIANASAGETISHSFYNSTRGGIVVLGLS